MQEPSPNADQKLCEFQDVALRVHPSEPTHNKEALDKVTSRSTRAHKTQLAQNILPTASLGVAESADSESSRCNRHLLHNGFFSSREPVLYQAIEDTKQALLQDNDGAYIGWWLLTL